MITVTEYITLILALVGAAMLFACFIPFLLFLKGKPMQEVEDVLEDGRRFFSLNLITAGHGALHYASLFMFDWLAKRYNVLEKRNQVPKHIQFWFKLYYWMFMTGGCLFFGAGVLRHFTE